MKRRLEDERLTLVEWIDVAGRFGDELLDAIARGDDAATLNAHALKTLYCIMRMRDLVDPSWREDGRRE